MNVSAWHWHWHWHWHCPDPEFTRAPSYYLSIGRKDRLPLSGIHCFLRLSSQNPLPYSRESHQQMFRYNFVRLRLGRRGRSGTPISTDSTHTRIQPVPLSYVSTHTANLGTNLHSSLPVACASTTSRPSVNTCDYGQGNQWLSSLAWRMVHQYPSGEICGLSDSQPCLEERYGQLSDSSPPDAARIPSPVQSPIRSDPDLDFSHDCHSQECYLYGPTVPTASSQAHNGYCPTPVVPSLSNHPLSSLQSPAELQQEIPIFPNNDGGFFPTGYPDDHVKDHVTPRYPVIAFETISPPGTPTALGVVRRSTFREGLPDPDSPNVIANDPIADPVSYSGGDRCSPIGYQCMCASLNAAQSLDVDRYSSSPHMALTSYYDSQNIKSDVLCMSHNVQSPQPYSSTDHLPTFHPPPEKHSGLLTTASSHQGKEAAPTELSPAIRVFINAPRVLPPILSQNESINAAVAEKQHHCFICGISFTQSQVLNRHMKDKHEDKGSCAHCSSFKWSRGRPHLYRRHLRAKHSELTFSGDPPGGTRKVHVLRVRQYKFPKNRSQVVSREPPIPYPSNLREGSSHTLASNEAAILSPQL
ncbi:hypothetical protein EDB86DRAFT_1070165 [Lactarius hatsudake]|nr:hypothetical protein EDB86DRAFT_1070165 [Lactarius hatsudake]